MRLLLTFILASALFAAIFPHPAQSQEVIALSVPSPSVDAMKARARLKFAEELFKISKQTGGASERRRISVLAPFGGSKISPFSELDADLLVLLDWSRPGTQQAIAQAFGEGRRRLQETLRRALNDGAMSTDDVVSSPVGAQLLGRLYLELGVTQVELECYVPRSATGTDDKLLASFSGPVVTEQDMPLIQKYRFRLRDRTRELVFLSWRISSDRVPNRSPIARTVLGRLFPLPFDWTYISADGLGLFSQNNRNGLQSASNDVAQMSQSIVLDYPLLPDFHKPIETPDGIVFNQGRAPLEPWGFRQVAKISPSSNVFGYSGLHPGDEVRIYSRKKNTNSENPGISSPSSLLRRVCGPVRFELR